MLGCQGEFSNLYWVTELAKAFPERVVWCVSVDGVSKVRAEPRLGNVKLASLKRGQEPDAQEGDVIVIVDPRSTDTWVAGAKLQPSETSPVIFLNSEVSKWIFVCIQPMPRYSSRWIFGYLLGL